MDKRNLEHLQYLDTILLYLRNGVNSSYLFKGLARDFEEDNISFDSQLVTEFSDTSKETLNLNVFDIEGFKEQALSQAILYLKGLDLVTIQREGNGENYTITLTYKGRIKITASFVEEYKKEKFEKELRTRHMKDTQTVARIQMITLPLAVAVAIVAICISYHTSSSSGNTINNHRKYYNYESIDNNSPNINK